MDNPPGVCNPKIIEVLREKEGKVKEWLSHAHRFIQIYFADCKIQPGAEEIFGDIILKIYHNERRWNPEKVDINSFMYNAIRSHIAAEARKAKRLVSTDDYNSDTLSFENRYEEEYHISLEEIELLQDLKEKFEIVLTQIKGDDDCEIIFYYLMDGFKPGEIAKELGISEAAVTNASRRIKYKVQKALEK